MHYFWLWPYIMPIESTWLLSCGQWLEVTQSMCISEREFANNLRGVPLRASSMVTRWYSFSSIDSSWSAYGAGYFRPWGARSNTAFELKYHLSSVHTFISLTTVYRFNFSAFWPSSASPFEPSLFLFLDNLAEPWASIQALLKHIEKTTGAMIIIKRHLVVLHLGGTKNT